MTTPADQATGTRRDHLVARYLERRGGTIGTGGKAAVALRFDHHLNPFRDKVLPLLHHYGLPWAQAINPDRIGTFTDSAVSWEQLQNMALRYGGEVWNHSANHRDATTPDAIYGQVVTSLEDIRRGLPRLAIEGWAPPGLRAGAYLGASPFQTPEQNTETYAGRLALEHHAVIAGYAGPLYRTLDGAGAIGATAATIDRADTARTLAWVDGAVARTAGLALTLHSKWLDVEGYITTAQLAAILAEVAARRDAGDLEVLSLSGLWAADASSSRRHDLLAHAVTPELIWPGNTYRALVRARDAAPFLGAPRELVVKVTATRAGRVDVDVTGRPTTSHDVTPGRPATIRRPVTLAVDEHDVEVRVRSTSAVTVDAVHLYAT
jgi:peptidoglycan/xylan/chitin deacetylase (PgdA/CDA1 family)